jgi:hypothetical protein
MNFLAAGFGLSCYKYLHGFDEQCPQNCKLADVANGATERWQYTFPNGRAYDVMAAPYVDSDGTVCQLTIFRKISR